METNSEPFFVGIVFATAFLTPFAGLFFAVAFANSHKWFTRSIYIVTALLIAALLIGTQFNLSFVGISADIILVACTYALIGIAIFSLYPLAKRTIFKLLAGLLALPFACMAFLVFPAGLAITFAAGDIQPVHQNHNEAGYTCRVSSTGNATTRYNWWIVDVYKPIGFIEVEVEELWVDQLEDRAVTPASLCEDTLSRYE